MKIKPTKSIEFSRREILRSAGVAVATSVGVSGIVSSGCLPAVPAATSMSNQASVNLAWEARAASLELMGPVFTLANPGPWAGKEPNHIPVPTAANGMIQLVTMHPMTAAHYITTHYLRDQNGLVIALNEFQSTAAMAQSMFALPAGTTAFTAYSYCNVHGMWRTTPFNVA